MISLVWHIGDVIRKLREARGWTKGQLAKKAGLEPNTVGSVERYGDTVGREPGTLEGLLRALEIDAARLHALVPVARDSISHAVIPTTDDQEVAELQKRLAALDPDQRKAFLLLVTGLSGEGHRNARRDEGHQPNTGTP